VCVTIVRSSTRVTEPLDQEPEPEIITIPAILDVEYTARALRFILADLGTPQTQTGAVCWCGEPIDIDAVMQQAPALTSEVSNSGA
jgi:hypothetical protein